LSQKPRRQTADTKAAADKAGDTIIHGQVPPREVLLQYIADNPDKASKREIAKAFGIKGAGRVELKDLLRDLEDEGLLQKKRKSLVRPRCPAPGHGSGHHHA